MNLSGFWSFVNFLENAQTLITLTGVSLLLSGISLLILVISLLRLKFKLDTKI